MIRSLQLFFIYWLFNLPINCQSRNLDEIKYIQIGGCETDEFFDIVTLHCFPCPTNQTSNKARDPFSCDCKFGYKTKYENKTLTCEKCPYNHVVSDNGKFCVHCSNDQIYNETTLQCENCSDSTMISIDQYINGSNTLTKECIKCSDYYTADQENHRCIPCHSSYNDALDKTCQCPEKSHVLVNGICILKSDIASIPDRKSSYIMEYYIGSKESMLLKDSYRISAFGCSYLKNISACQLLSNLCVLMHYNYDNELNACSFYRATFSESFINLPNYVPWLYYDTVKVDHIIANKNIKAQFSFKSSSKSLNSKLNLVVAHYSITGNFISFGLLEDNLDLCPEIAIAMRNGLRFGQTFHSSCMIPMKSILHDYSTGFYDLYLQYNLGKELKLYPIPVLNMNYKQNNIEVNKLSRDRWQFTRRFFFVDNISGRVEAEKGNFSVPRVVRYAKSIEIFVQLQDGMDGYVFPPFIKIYYEDLPAKELENLNYVSFSVKIVYIVNFDKALNIISIFLSLLATLAILLSFIKTWSWLKRCGKIDITAIIFWICHACGYLSNAFFFVLFSVCFIWVLTYKNQDVVWIFLPSDEQEYFIKQFVIASFSLKIIHVCYVLYNQMTVDLFIIDWEQPRILNNNTTSKKSTSGKTRRKNEPLVSIWRTYFIANEWTELQTHRKISLSVVLFTIIFFLKVLDYENSTRLHPIENSHSKSAVFSPFSFISRFAYSVFIFIMTSVVQSLFMVIFYERYIENKLQMFIDLCSMANISVLVLKHRLYGYYIHGRSVNGEADLDMQSYYEQLKREEEDLCGRRGLEPSSECQTFEVLITNKFRLKYDSILDISDDANHGGSSNKPSDTDQIELRIKAHDEMKKFLTVFLQHAHNQRSLDYIVKEKYFLETALDLEFQESKDVCLFFRDYRHTFDKVLLYGEEMLFLSFEMMTFSFVDLISTDFLLACFITFIVHKIITFLRYHGGKRNMVTKTLVDKRFLI